MPKAKFQAVEESDDEGAAGGASSAAAGGAPSAAGSGDTGEIHHILKQLGVEGMDIMYLDDLSADGVAEVYSCPRTAAIAPEQLKQGWSLDRLTGWDLSCPRQRDRARQLFRRTRPKLLIGSPMCTFFSSLMDLNWKRMGKEKSRRCWREAVGHLEFCVELYKEQMAAGRLFLHEHPLGASSWQVDAMAKLIEEPGVVKVTAHQCMLGLLTRGPDGAPLPAKKATGFLTNSLHIAARLHVKCDGEHTHQPLVGGRASRAAQYPEPLCRAICEGLAEHLLHERIEKEYGHGDLHAVEELEALGLSRIEADRRGAHAAAGMDKVLEDEIAIAADADRPGAGGLPMEVFDIEDERRGSGDAPP